MFVCLFCTSVPARALARRTVDQKCSLGGKNSCWRFRSEIAMNVHKNLEDPGRVLFLIGSNVCVVERAAKST